MNPLLSARAAIAGALVMLLGAWVFIERDRELGPEHIISGVGILLVIVALLVGVDPRNRGS